MLVERVLGRILSLSLSKRVRRLIPAGFDAESVVVAVTVLILVLLVVPPVAFLVFGSLRSEGPGAPRAEFTLDNWAYVLRSDSLLAVRNSLFLGLATSVVAVILGVSIAWFVVRTNLPGRTYWTSLLVVPLLFSPLLTSLAWVGLAGPNAGLLNLIAKQVLGIPNPVFDIYSLPGMIFVLSLHYTPYVYLAMRAALLNMDPELEDASRVLGAGPLMTIRRVTLPVVAPAILGSAILVLILAAEEFAVPTTLGISFGYATLPYLIYSAMGEFPSSPPLASALALALTVVMLAGMLIYLRSIGLSKRYVTVSGKGARVSRGDLSGLGTIIGLTLILGYLILGVFLPYAMLVFGSFSKYFATRDFSTGLLTLDNYAQIFNSPQFVRGLQNTLILVLLGATVIALFGAFLSWISIRSHSPLRRIVDTLAGLPIMISGIAIGVGILWTYVFLKVGLYGTIGVLLIAFVTRFIGHGTRIISPSLLQLNSELEEAAYTLGSSRLRTLRTVTLPLLRGPIAAAWVIAAIFISLEISSSIFLYTGQSLTLSVFVWLIMHGQFVSQAFAAGTLLAGLSFLVVVIAQRRLRVLEKL